MIAAALASCGARTGLRLESRDASFSSDAGRPRDDAAPSFDAGDDASAVVTALDGLRWELPCEDPRSTNICTTMLDNAAATTVRGPAGAEYDVTARFRGVVELKTYLGGTTDGRWNVGGTPASDSWNVYDLAVSEPPLVAYVNAGDSGLYVCTAIDFTRTFRVASGATVRLIAGSVNELEVENVDASGSAILIPGVAPYPSAYDGQFAEMDVVAVVRVR